MRASIAIVAIGLIVTCPDVSACDADSDCGVGGICIKREKRARGVCYKDKAKRQQLMEFMGDPEQLIKEQLPGRKIRGNCTGPRTVRLATIAFMLISKDAASNFKSLPPEGNRVPCRHAAYGCCDAVLIKRPALERRNTTPPR